MRRVQYIFLLLMCLVWGAVGEMHAYQRIEFRYVSPKGDFSNDGTSWDKAKNNLQNAIDVLYAEITKNNDTTTLGYIYVEGSEVGTTYVPTRNSTNNADGSIFNTSFRIYERIYIFGGFKGDEIATPYDSAKAIRKDTHYPELYLPNDRVLTNGQTMQELFDAHDEGDMSGPRSWDFKYKSILTGNHHTNNISFLYDEKRGVYKTTFPLSSYHVVWFGTNDTLNPERPGSNIPDYLYTGVKAPNKDAKTDTVNGQVYYYYQLDKLNKTAVLTKGPSNYTATTIQIPDSVRIDNFKYAVIGIEKGAFASSPNLKKVLFDATNNKVTSIGEGAFYGCTLLDSISIPDGVTSIEKCTFYGCSQLKRVNLPASVKTIGKAAFYGCSSLEEINSTEKKINLPQNLTTIGRYAFAHCTSSYLKFIGFPNSMTKIERYAFCGCSNLDSVSIPMTVTSIGRYAFLNCTSKLSSTVFANSEADEVTGHYKGLERVARLDGFTIEGGNASSTNLQGHDHTGFGGGVYMVRNAELENCIIHHCAATQRGGGIYMDGGGRANYCYIHTCQATGYGMQQGYGGAVCIDYGGSLEHSYVVQCAARIGAGVAICQVPEEYPIETAKLQDSTFVKAYKGEENKEATIYAPFTKSTLISNCTSNAEGAGIYLNMGGMLDHLSVVNNECIGPDVIYYGRRHGRTGGIYVRENGAIYNTVVWGNKCEVNSNIQFAAFRSDLNSTITIDHSAFARGDITDWATVTRNSVISLNDANVPTSESQTGNFPIFNHPVVNEEYVNGSPVYTLAVGIQHTNGEVNPNDNAAGRPYQDIYNWHPLSVSSLRGRGKQIVDVTIASADEIKHANADRDAIGINFESVSTCGALTNTYRTVKYALLDPLEGTEGRLPGEKSDGEHDRRIPTIFVDPNVVTVGEANTDSTTGFLDEQPMGFSWVHPLNNFQDAVYFFRQYLNERQFDKLTKAQVEANPALLEPYSLTKEDYRDHPERTYYRLPNEDGDSTNYPHVQILVKEGTMNVAGREAYLFNHIRTASIRPVSNMRLYGGYPSKTAGTETTGRDPRSYNSDVTADISGGDFNNHSVHVFSIANMHDVVIDGFRLMGGNANIASEPDSTASQAAKEEWEFYSTLANGGGVAINNANEEIPRDMTGNILRNCIIANCAAPEGAAIYVNGDANHGHESRKCKAELTIVNSVIRNCTAGDTYGDPNRFVAKPGDTFATMQITKAGVVTANGKGGKIIVRNSDVVNNCGFPFKCTPIDEIPAPLTSPSPANPTYGGLLSRDTAEKANSIFQTIGRVEVYNSVIFSNGLRVHIDRSNIQSTVFCPKESWYNVSGEYIYMNYDVLLPDDYLPDSIIGDNLEIRLRKQHIYRTLTHNKKNNNTLQFHRVNDGGQQGYQVTTEDSEELQAATSDTVHYADFVNPSRNVGHSTTDDKSFYGGRVNYEPLPTNPIVNASNADTTMGPGILAGADSLKTVGYDMGLNPRTRGGDPDIGAFETDRLPAEGAVLYVTPNGAGRRDGSSWANAIAGNTVYVLDSIAGPDLATGDQIDSVLTCDRVLDSEGNPILTTNEKYNGGWGKVWFVDKTTGGVDTITVTKTWTTEKNVYDDGSRAGEEDDPIQDNVYSESSDTKNTPGSTPEGFVPGYGYDPRYPYGEISGGSRSFWRANPYHNGTDWNNAASYSNTSKFITACNANGWINNARKERYVGGLQYAVEMASAANKSYHRDSVQVWVGAGIYSDYKGFVMRDSVTVLGGFPATKYKTPGLTERQALMSNVVSIPKSKPAEKLDAADYETILQISDVNPNKNADRTTLDSAAVKYWDDDYSYSEHTEVTQYKYKSRTIIHHYRSSDVEQVGEDVQDTYMQYANMTGTNPNQSIIVSNATDEGIDNGRHYYRFGNREDAPNGRDCWHMSYPSVDNYIANLENNNTYNNNCPKFICDPQTGNPLKEGEDKVTYTGNWIMIGNGSLTDLQIWQTLSAVPSGRYQLSIDMACQYKNLYNASEDVNTHFYIIDGNNDTLASTALKAPKYSSRDDSRKRAFRHVLSFNNPSSGDITIKLIVGDGWRNTSANYPSSEYSDYVTETGVDPVPIPCLYVGQNGKCTDANKWGSKNPNARELWLSNIHIKPVTMVPGYELANTDDDIVDKEDVEPEDPVISETDTYTVQTHRTTLRKRVLTMPDECIPTYGAGSVGDPTSSNRGRYGDDLSHTHRVFGPSKEKRSSWKDASFVKEDPNYVEYNEANWDGFTIRHGLIHEEGMGHGGGAGVNIYEGAHLRNCIVVNNMSKSGRVKGGGIYCDGATATIEGCFVLNNISAKQTSGTTQNQVFAGGMFLYEGTCFNSLFANNYSFGSAGGVGFCVGKFYNNTIAYNTCSLSEGSVINGGAISVATESTPNLFVANTIVYGNNGRALRERTEDQYKGAHLVNPFLNCYIQTEKPLLQETYLKNIKNHDDDSSCYGVGNILLNGVAPTNANSPFAADALYGKDSEKGAKATNNYGLSSYLSSDSSCINSGTEAFGAALAEAFTYKHGDDWASDAKRKGLYDVVAATILPQTDVAYADRVQDCRIDMGAYEYDGTREIEPKLFKDDKKAIFYVNFIGAGKATAEGALDAACYIKFQKVLDAAGRWRYASYYCNAQNTIAQNPDSINFTKLVLAKELTLAGVTIGPTPEDTVNALNTLKDYEVIVRLQGVEDTVFSYVPTRSASIYKENENVLEYSLIVPRGVRIEGGYDEAFEQPRDILGRPTYFSGGDAVYHVVTFTNDLFDVEEELIGNGGQLAFLGDKETYPTVANKDSVIENNRAVIDGLFIEGGYANGSDEEQQRGAGAVVTGYAHIKNCVVQDNNALGNGGGLYLDSHALVSGTIIKQNSAKYGGGIYVYEPEKSTDVGLSTYAHVISSTIVGNKASVSAGGLYFDTNVRANSTVIWSNTANENPNVAGSDATNMAQLVENYPMNYCGVGSRRMAGVNNIELPEEASEGVRWDGTMPYETTGTGELYYPITVSSVLARAGMTYAAYREFMAKYPTLETTDIFGLNRMAQTKEDDWVHLAVGDPYAKELKNNVFIEMGARVLNATFEVKLEIKHIMRRLFVTTTQRLPTEAAQALQNLTIAQEKAIRGQQAWDKFGTDAQEATGKTLFPDTWDTFSDVEKNRHAIDSLGNYKWSGTDLGADEAAKIDSLKRRWNMSDDSWNALGSNDSLRLVAAKQRLGTEEWNQVASDEQEAQGKALYNNDSGWDALSLSQKETWVKDSLARAWYKGLGTTGQEQLRNDTAMYKQMGSCFLNPFHRVGDALDYIVGVRKDTTHTITVRDVTMKVSDYYKDQRFEVYVCGGTFYPFRDAYGQQGESRANTFAVPEGVTIVGGVNHQLAGHAYCQEGHPADTTDAGGPSFRDTVQLAGYVMNGADTYTIRTDRDHMDRNGNNVDEPWEMEEQTILSGVAVQNDVSANVYHVITCFADSTRLGKLPTRWGKSGKNNILPPLYDGNLTSDSALYAGKLLDEIEREAEDSRDYRTILIDGVTITGGYANKIDDHDTLRTAQTLTYFRGGGVLVEGNWDASFDSIGDLPEVLGVAKRDIPLILTACLIKDNTAGNGGGVYTNGSFYSFGCHFTQNLAVGPLTPKDQDFIPWTAGGAIANNYNVHVWNTLFDNNEAQRGLYDIRDGETPMRTIKVSSGDSALYNPVYNANSRQGYAGTISCSETGLVRACNCDFVRNKAVAFPAIYNFLDNNLRALSSGYNSDSVHYYGKGWHFAVNSLFWGNEATLPASKQIETSTEWEVNYYDSIYGTRRDTIDKRQPYHVANFAPKLDVATLTFCSYEDGTGRDGTVWWSNQNRAKGAPIKEKNGLKGLERLYAGMFTDVLDEYFGYYRENDPGHPYYVNKDTNDVNSQFMPTKLDTVVLRHYDKYVYDKRGGLVSFESIDTIENEYKRYSAAMDTLRAVAYNYNLILGKENTGTGGPFFVQPSLKAGVEGYMENANWLVSRLNNTIDTGWGFLKQQVTQPDESTGLYDTKLMKEVECKTAGGTKDTTILVPEGHKLALDGDSVPRTYSERYYKGYKISGSDTTLKATHESAPQNMIIPYGKKLSDEANPFVATDSLLDTVKVANDSIQIWYMRFLDLVEDTSDLRTDEYDPFDKECVEEQYHDLFGEGFYNIHSKNIHLRFHGIGYPNLLPIGEDIYMNYVHEGDTEVKNMRRISTHPKMGVQDVYIDMGIYEYQYVQLVTAGSETDVLWVGEDDAGTGDGSTWANATSRLQDAISDLLRSRNDRDKIIKLKGGKYSPPSSVDNQSKAFFIEVPDRTDGITLPKTLNPDVTHTVKSLTIRGGYSTEPLADDDDGESSRDIELYPVTFEMEEGGQGGSTLDHLLVIQDAEEKGCYMNYLTNNNKDFKENVMPIVIDGITFVNPYGTDQINGGAAIFYEEQKQTYETGINTNDYRKNDHLLKAKTYLETHNNVTDTVAIPKLLIKNCVFKCNGVNEHVSAVKIKKGGGQSVIANCLFHSNSGNPLDVVNTEVVNCTFAMNGGHIKLMDETEYYHRPDGLAVTAPTPSASYPSGLYNSIIWRDDLKDGEKKQLEKLKNTSAPQKVDGKEQLVNGQPVMTPNDTVENLDMPMLYNAITKQNANPTKDTAHYIYDDTLKSIIGNYWLSRNNTDVFLGPNFANPDTAATTDSARLARDFHINPSARLISRADTTVYRLHVPYYPERSEIKKITLIEKGVTKDPYIFHSVQRHDGPVTVTSPDTTYYPRAMVLSRDQLQGTEDSASISTLIPENYPYRRTVYQEETRKDKDVKVDSTRVSNKPYTESELAFNPRWSGAGIELGPYECVATLQRVLYVQAGSSGKDDGSSWENAFGRGELQKAIDVASIFSATNPKYPVSRTEEARPRAYVFVKSWKDDNYGDVKVRDGVTVYGGISSTVTEVAGQEELTLGNFYYTDAAVNNYINQMRAKREPIAAEGTKNFSLIKSVLSDPGSTSDMGFMIEGFKISGGTDLTKSPVVLDLKKTVVNNCLITGNTMSGNQPVVAISNGLLYNSLIYGNRADTIVQIADTSTKAGVLNCTVIAFHSGDTTIVSRVNGSVVNTITYNTEDKNIARKDDRDVFVKCNVDTMANLFAPYLTATNSYTLPAGFASMVAHRPYHYQLHEKTPCINAGQESATVLASTIFSPYSEFIHYTDDATTGLAGDRDPLGNPRQLGDIPDIGCYETWRISGDRYATNETADKTFVNSSVPVQYATNYGGHLYPHEGSVLYVMKGGNLDIRADGETPRFKGANAFKAAYVLVEDSGSIYGNGNDIVFSYVAAEKTFESGAQYGLISMPFDYYLDATTKRETFTAYTYDAAGRSEFNYDFKSENSGLWKTDLKPIQNTHGQIKRTEGWLLEFNDTLANNDTLRFTGWGTSPTDTVYFEGFADDTVRLDQNDLRTSDGSAHFTREEDMGWNLKGLPYLVSGYRTDDPSNEDDDDYGEDFNMNIPHIYYKMGDNGAYIKAPDAIFTKESWVNGSTLSLNEAFFTQTAVIGTYNSTLRTYENQYENLVFKHPALPTTSTPKAAAPLLLMRDLDGEGDILTVKPDEEAPKTVNYSLGRDGVKWLMSNTPQLYLLSAAKSRLSLLGAAPTEVDIPLGVSVPEDPRYQDMPRTFTFSLPEPEAFEGYPHVWLIDRALNHITNLVEDNYAAALSPGTDNSRFILRIGGFPYENMYGRREYIVYSWKRDLHIRGLVEGDIIQVYSLSGQMVLNTTARDPEFTAQLPQAGGIYVVRVNDFTTKVRNL